jgi:CheY-like chemotaxis protein
MAKNVLIVDDNEHLRRILALFLQSRGYATSEAESGHEAIETAIAVKPNLIILDLTLPDMNGTDVARALRKCPTTARIPIVGCSAYFGSELRQEALRAGMADYLQKPISATAIETVVEQLILSENAAA